jgi:sporulation protein YlmC with PRC-barrel domain
MLASDLERIIDEHAYTQDGDKIGKVGTVYLDDASGEPEFVTVKTGLFGTKESFAPVRDARITDDGLVLPYDKDRVKNAPKVDEDQHLSPAEERDLYDYYGVPFAENPEPVEEPGRVRLREYVVTERR